MMITAQSGPLAQRYRPARFADVVGQDVFVSVLTKALSQKRVGHGVLLTGMRGVGKTTLARLLAKALCCTQLGSDGEPCQQCSSCVAAVQDKHVDIVELDAASHTGIDDMRVILESCPYQPLMGQHKVYIMDEVHMLSKSAFNALLKTLEEPPPHVTFVFATTEVHKVPATIISRCQQLHLHRLQEASLAPYLVHVASCEGRVLDQSAALLIAKISEGGVRDALSLLERVLIVSSPTETMTHHMVESLLGLPSDESIQSLIQAMADQDPQRAIPLLHNVYQQGSDPCVIAKDLLHAIHAMAQQAWQHPPQASAPHSLSLERLDQWWHMGQKGWTEIQHSPFPLLSLEMLLLRMMYILSVPTPSQLLPLVETLPSSPPSPSPSPSPTGITTLARDAHLSSVVPTGSVRNQKQAQGGPALKTLVAAETSIQSLRDIVTALEQHKEVLLQAQIHNYVSWVGCHNNTVTLHWDEKRGPMPAGFTQTLEKALASWCEGKEWRIQWSQDAPLTKSAVAQEEDRKSQNRSVAQADPLVQAVMTAFPGASIESIEPLNTAKLCD
jgi:DNA polymerase-3 subunit gamma/tau